MRHIRKERTLGIVCCLEIFHHGYLLGYIIHNNYKSYNILVSVTDLIYFYNTVYSLFSIHCLKFQFFIIKRKYFCSVNLHRFKLWQKNLFFPYYILSFYIKKLLRCIIQQTDSSIMIIYTYRYRK